MLYTQYVFIANLNERRCAMAKNPKDKISSNQEDFLQQRPRANRRTSSNRDAKYNKNKRMLRRKRRRRIKFVFFCISMFLLFLSGFSFTYAGLLFAKINTQELPTDNKSLGISEEELKDIQNRIGKGEIMNIALFGIDTRDPAEQTRSDSIMIASIDYKHNKIKLSSVLRDTRVQIDGHGMDKINHAYAYGGPELAVKTLNQNFGLDIREFVTINFWGLEEIIDGLGGITLDVKKNEVNEINKFIKELCDIDKKKYTPIKKSGEQVLNGRQATAYGRIRYVGNGDFERTERQRKVLDQIFKKIVNAGVTQYPKIVDSILPHITTSFSKTDILAIGTQFLTSGIKKIDQARFPVNGYWDNLKLRGIDYIEPDMDKTKGQIKDFIYDDVKPDPLY